jgi:hypothetical protein
MGTYHHDRLQALTACLLPLVLIANLAGAVQHRTFKVWFLHLCVTIAV